MMDTRRTMIIAAAGGTAEAGRRDMARIRRPGGYDEIVRHMRRAEAMRAEAIAEFFGSLGRGAAGSWRAAGAALARRRRQRAAAAG